MLALMGSGPMRELDTFSGAILRLTSTSFGVGRQLDRESRRAFRSGVDHTAARTFHRYMGDARKADSLYEQVESATSSLRDRPLLTIFGEHYDPLGFQPRWKELFPHAQQIVVPKGHHFPMCDAPDLVADSIRSWHRAQPVASSR
jgi:haloalkane dehalogenase